MQKRTNFGRAYRGIIINHITLFVCLFNLFNVGVRLANQDKFTLTKFSSHIEFHDELSI